MIADFNKIFIILTFFALPLFGQWEVYHRPFQSIFSDIDFVDNSGWISGYNILLKTEDSGHNWQELQTPYNLFLIDFVDNQSGWAYGFDSTWNNVILKSEDGGSNWNIKYQFSGGYAQAIYALNADSFIAVGNSTILKTFDGGDNWNTDTIHTELLELYSVELRKQRGIAAGGVYDYPNNNRALLLKTFNAGANWTATEITEFTSIHDLQFISDSTLFFSATDDSGGILFCRTTDMLNSWTIQTAFRNEYQQSFKYFALSPDTVFAVISGAIIKSTNGGVDWQTIEEIPAWGNNKLLITQNNGFLLGTVGVNGPISSAYGPVIFNSFDQGESWDLKTISYPFRDIFFINQTKGFATGGSNDLHFTSGELFVTHDGGISWDIALTTGNLSGSIQFIDANMGFFLTEGSGIYQSTDGGDNWLLAHEDVDIMDSYFLAEESGWFSKTVYDNGNYFASIFTITNEEEYWQSVHQQPVEYAWTGFKTIHMLDENYGWTAGDGGLIAKSVNGFWNAAQPFTDLPINKIFFADQDNGWASAGYYYDNQLLFSTSDGGASWQSLDFNYKIEDIFFQDTNKGWICGWDSLGQGIILYTEDGGDQWQPLIENLSVPVYKLHFSNGEAWAAGAFGLILHSYDGITWLKEPGLNAKIAAIASELSQSF